MPGIFLAFAGPYYWDMRRTFFYLSLMLSVAIPAQAYVTYHPTDPAAVLLTAFTVNAVVDGVQSHNQIEVWSLSGGVIDYVLDVEALSFSATNCSAVNTLSLNEIVEAGADAAIVEGVWRGFPACFSIPFTKNIRIWSVSCAARIGTGCSTTFEACSTEEWSYRSYEVYCPGSGTPIITQKPNTPSSCSGDCESSCSESNFE